MAATPNIAPMKVTPPPLPAEPGRAFALLDEEVALRRRWQAAIAPGDRMPPFEELAVGSLGRSADRLMLVRSAGGADFEILRVGGDIPAQVSGLTEHSLISALPENWARPLHATVSQAIERCEPVVGLAHDVRGGVIEAADLVCFPLANRWGGPMVLIYVRPRPKTLNLLDASFGAAREGFITLAPLPMRDGGARDFQVIALNEGASRLLGRAESDLRWRHLGELLPRLAGTDAGARLARVFDTEAADRFELDYPVADGSKRSFSVGVAKMGDFLAVTLTDIAELKAREASFRALFQDNPVPMWVLDRETLRFLDVNAAATSHYGYGREAFLAMALTDLDAGGGSSVDAATTVRAAGSLAAHRRADGSTIDVLCYASRIEYQNRDAALAALIDVTERRRAEARIAHMAHHDALTNLPNRVLFRERLDEALTRAARAGDQVAVLCVDLDLFKTVNDTLGHPVGDRLLQKVGERLVDAIREVDVVARLGGDEFAVIQPMVHGAEDASAFAQRLVDVISRPYSIDGHQVVIGASVGVALSPTDGATPDALLKNADMALYRAKGEGRRKFRFFESEMDARLQARRALELDLRRAFAAAEFELHYQPVVSLSERRVTGFEALLRWRHPERGLVSPADFVPLAEEIGLIVPLGEWVLNAACREAAAWPGDVTLAVNVSPAQFRDRRLVSTVVGALAHSGLEPTRLELEITETVLLKDSAANISVLSQLRELGVRIAMDDFGAGYSSLSYLRSFPFDRIKIDRSFIAEIESRSDCRAIVGAVLALGSSLGMATTAEGVETEGQLALLRAQNCTDAQGYLFSPALPAGRVAMVIATIAERLREIAAG